MCVCTTYSAPSLMCVAVVGGVVLVGTCAVQTGRVVGLLLEGCANWTGPIPDLGRLVKLTKANFCECTTLTGDITGLAKCTDPTHADFFYCVKLTGDISGLGACRSTSACVRPCPATSLT